MLRNGHESHQMGPDLGRASVPRTGHKSLQPSPRKAGLASSLAAQRAFYDHWWAEAWKV